MKKALIPIIALLSVAPNLAEASQKIELQCTAVKNNYYLDGQEIGSSLWSYRAEIVNPIKMAFTIKEPGHLDLKYRLTLSTLGSMNDRSTHSVHLKCASGSNPTVFQCEGDTSTSLKFSRKFAELLTGSPTIGSAGPLPFQEISRGLDMGDASYDLITRYECRP